MRGISEKGQTRGGNGTRFDLPGRGVEKSKDQDHRSPNQKAALAPQVSEFAPAQIIRTKFFLGDF